MTKQELHTAFGNWLAEKGWKELPHKAEVYSTGDGDERHISLLIARFLIHIENLLQDYE